MATSNLIYSNETCFVTPNGMGKIEAIEVRFFRNVEGYPRL